MTIALVAVVLLASVTAAGFVSDTPAGISETETTSTDGVEVSVTAPDEVGVDDRTNATVSVTGADNGISAYELTLGVTDDDVASVEDDITVHANGTDGPLVDAEPAAYGSGITVTVALLDATHDPADEIDLFDIAVTGDAIGETDISVLRVEELVDADLAEYSVSDRLSASLTVADPSTPRANLSISAPSSIDVGETETATVTVENASAGVGAYELVVASTDPESATLGEDIDVLANGTDGPLVNVQRSADGSQLTTTVALLDATHDPAEEIDLFHVPVTGEAEEAVTLDVVDVREFAGSSGEAYLIEDTAPATVDVGSGGIALPPPPTEPDPDPATFVVGFDTAVDTVTAGETVEIGATVENVGEESGSTTLTLLVDGDVVAENPVDLGAGATQTVSLEVTAPDETEDIDVTVQTPDDEASTTVTVEASDPVDDSESDDADATDETIPDGSDDSVPGFGVVVALLGLLGAGVLSRRTRL